MENFISTPCYSSSMIDVSEEHLDDTWAVELYLKKKMTLMSQMRYCFVQNFWWAIAGKLNNNLQNDLLKFLQSKQLSTSDYQQHLSTIQKWKNVVHKSTTHRLILSEAGFSKMFCKRIFIKKKLISNFPITFRMKPNKLDVLYHLLLIFMDTSQSSSRILNFFRVEKQKCIIYVRIWTSN